MYLPKRSRNIKESESDQPFRLFEVPSMHPDRKSEIQIIEKSYSSCVHATF